MNRLLQSFVSKAEPLLKCQSLPEALSLVDIVEACFNDAFGRGRFWNLILYVNMACNCVCYNAPHMPIVKNNTVALLNLTLGIKMLITPDQGTPKSCFR